MTQNKGGKICLIYIINNIFLSLRIFKNCRGTKNVPLLGTKKGISSFFKETSQAFICTKVSIYYICTTVAYLMKQHIYNRFHIIY